MLWDSQAVIREAEASLAALREPIEAARAARAQRIAAKRADSAARVARAHHLAMAAVWRPTPRPKRQRRGASAAQSSVVRPAVTPGFEDHPRTLAEALARFAAYRARQGHGA